MSDRSIFVITNGHGVYTATGLTKSEREAARSGALTIIRVSPPDSIEFYGQDGNWHEPDKLDQDYPYTDK